MKLAAIPITVILAVILVPALVLADADLVQDSCEGYYDEFGNRIIKATFTLVNFSLPTAVCDLHFIPEPLPPVPGCELTDCTAPGPVPGDPNSRGWSCFLGPLGGADWFANTPADCIPPGSSKSGFEMEFMPDGPDPFCCYIAQFTDATGAVILEQEVCFCTLPVPDEKTSWGLLKSLYR